MKNSKRENTFLEVMTLGVLKNFFVKPPELAGLRRGDAGEEWVAYLYRKKGFDIVARNFAVFAPKKLGELDIVCRRGKQIVVVEVKTRSSASNEFMPAEDSLHSRKQLLLRRMAELYLRDNPKYEGYEIQIDVALVVMNPVDNSVESVKLLENAIEGE